MVAKRARRGQMLRVSTWRSAFLLLLVIAWVASCDGDKFVAVDTPAARHPGAAGSVSTGGQPGAAGSVATSGVAGASLAPEAGAGGTTHGTGEDDTAGRSSSGAASGAGASGMTSNPVSAGGSRAGGAASGSGGSGITTDPVSAAGSSAGATNPPASSIDCRAAGDGRSTVTLINECTGELSFRSSAGAAGDLKPGAHVCLQVGDVKDAIASTEYWGFIGKDPGDRRHTLAVINLNTTFNDFDWYDISHVDAFNLPVQIVPVAAPNCRTLTCAQNLLPNCPSEAVIKDVSGEIVACVNPDANDATSVVAQYFKKNCPDAYSWTGDSASSLASCVGEDYDIIFCPAPSP